MKIERKTQGNPFFITQVLKVLHQEGFMHFNHQAKHWQFNANPIGSATSIEDVVDFMGRQLQKLPESTQSLLKLATCFGNVLDLNTLSRLAGLSSSDTGVHLWSALPERFIILIEEETVALVGCWELDAIDPLPTSMTQPEALAAMQLMTRILNVTLTVNPTLSPLVIFKQLHLSLQWGNTALSASAYLRFAEG